MSKGADERRKAKRAQLRRLSAVPSEPMAYTGPVFVLQGPTGDHSLAHWLPASKESPVRLALGSGVVIPGVAWPTMSKDLPRSYAPGRFFMVASSKGKPGTWHEVTEGVLLDVAEGLRVCPAGLRETLKEVAMSSAVAVAASGGSAPAPAESLVVVAEREGRAGGKDGPFRRLAKKLGLIK